MPKYTHQQLSEEDKTFFRETFYRKGSKPTLTAKDVNRACDEIPGFTQKWENLLASKGEKKLAMNTIRGSLLSLWKQDLKKK